MRGISARADAGGGRVAGDPARRRHAAAGCAGAPVAGTVQPGTSRCRSSPSAGLRTEAA